MGECAITKRNYAHIFNKLSAHSSTNNCNELAQYIQTIIDMLIERILLRHKKYDLAQEVLEYGCKKIKHKDAHGKYIKALFELVISICLKISLRYK